jgi:hypothetical protein
MKSLIAEGRAAANSHLDEILADLAQRLKLRHRPRVIAVERLDSPLVFGIFRPAVILPAKMLSEFSAAEWRIALAHELAHVKRLDLLWTWVPAVVQALFFFHPLVWLGTREWRLSQEMACDEKVLRTIGTPAREYGHVLLKLLASEAPRGLSAAMSESGNQLQRRLEMMKYLGSCQWQRIAILLSAGLGLIPWRLVGTGRSLEPGNASVRWGTASEEVAAGLQLVSSQSEFRPGETVEMAIMVRNCGRHTIEIRCPRPARWTARLNPRGEVELQPMTTGNQLESVSTLRLAPDQSAQLFEPNPTIYLLPDQLDASPQDFGIPALILPPGRYRLNCATSHPFLSLNGHRWPHASRTGSAEFDVHDQPAIQGSPSNAPTIAWGTPVQGLQAGLAFAPAKSDRSGTMDLDFYVRNLLDKPLAFTFRPLRSSEWVLVESGNARGEFTLRPADQGTFTTTVVLDPGERFILGHPALQLVPKKPTETWTYRIHAEIHQQAHAGREGTPKPWSIDLETGQLELKPRPIIAHADH